MYSTCLTAENFVPLGFLSDFSRKWNIAIKNFPPFFSQPQVQGALRLASFSRHINGVTTDF